jgi:hypothetical protein
MHLTFSKLTVVCLSLFGTVLAVPAPASEPSVNAGANLDFETRQAESYPGVRPPPYIYIIATLILAVL